jgi:glycosyltransferase involved in cell wall biosynthesis
MVGGSPHGRPAGEIATQPLTWLIDMGNSAPLVSILIPCHNAEKYVGAAVQSALNQTWTNREIVVVNDGSTDHSAEVLEPFRAKGLKIIHQENRGQCAAANRAFAESTGDYVKFFDADDLLDLKTVELQMGRLAGSQTAVASAEWGRFFDDDLATFILNPQNVWKDMDPLDWLVESWMDAWPMMQCALWLIPRAVLDRSGLWDTRLSLFNDFEFFARVLCHAGEIRFTPGARLCYRSGLCRSASSDKSRLAVESACLALTLGTDHLLSRRRDERAKLACANMLQDFVYTYYPEHPDLRRRLTKKMQELGGSDLPPTGPPRFRKLTKVLGWKMARRVQRLAGH